MVRLKGPLFSLSAQKSIGKILTYSKRKSGQQARAYNKPLRPPTPAQRGQRRLTEFLVAQWQNMSGADKATWEANAKASGLKLAGYHYFLREAQRDLYTHTGLAGYWHCNEIVDGKVLDISGNANHGTLKPDYPANAPVLVDSYKTKFSKALLYDGVDEYVEIPAAANLLKGWLKATIFSWLYPTAYGGRYLYKEVTLFNAGSLDTGLYVRLADDDDNLPDAKADDPIVPLNQWTQVAIVFNDDNDYKIKIYLNGIPAVGYVYQRAGTAKLKDVAGKVFLGTKLDDYYTGRHDEICFYNRALSAAEIATRYKFAMREVD